ncbi:MAG: (4Fe-4S)-binding protein [Bacteroidota bacterium]
MENITKHYNKDGLTVNWQPHLCQHATLCWKGLEAVFDPRRKPWIDMDGAEAARIVEQVKACPSGALSYSMDEEVAKQ